MTVTLVKFFDRFFGNLLCHFLGLFCRKKPGTVPLKKIKTILAIQLWGIGETILTLPALHALAERFSDASITVLTTKRNKDVYVGRPRIKIIELGMNPLAIISFILNNYKKYDAVIDFEEYLTVSSLIAFFTGAARVGYAHGARSKLYTHTVAYNDSQHVVETFLDLVSVFGAVSTVKKLPHLAYSPNDKRAVDAFFSSPSAVHGAVIGIAPGVAESGKARRWPPANFSELCNRILSRQKTHVKIFFFGTLEESSLVKNIIEGIDKKYQKQCIDATGKITLPQLFYAVTRCAVFIGNDSGGMHIAAAQGVKTIGLFGPNLPLRFGPYGGGNIAIYRGEICKYSPCINVHKGQVPDCLYRKKSKDYQKCMKNINVKEVADAVQKLLA